MTEDAFCAAMLAFLGERLEGTADGGPPVDVTADDDLVALGLLDSLRVIQMIAHAEDLTGGTVDLGASDLESLYTVRGLYAAVR